MKKFKWHISLAIALLLSSVMVYWLQIKLFARPDETFFYLFQDMAFLPVSVLLVSLVINELMVLREKRTIRQKMNMVVGTFFVQLGNRLLKELSLFDRKNSDICSLFDRQHEWTDKFIKKTGAAIKNHATAIDILRSDLNRLRDLLTDEKDFIIQLLGNPNLLEHQDVTDLLWAISHLREELALRENLTDLEEEDAKHLASDLARAYTQLICQWLSYMRHLRDHYPYMFSLARRTNPFDQHASVPIH
jgi:hypothetical protein